MSASRTGQSMPRVPQALHRWSRGPGAIALVAATLVFPPHAAIALGVVRRSPSRRDSSRRSASPSGRFLTLLGIGLSGAAAARHSAGRRHRANPGVHVPGWTGRRRLGRRASGRPRSASFAAECLGTGHWRITRRWSCQPSSAGVVPRALARRPRPGSRVDFARRDGGCGRVLHGLNLVARVALRWAPDRAGRRGRPRRRLRGICRQALWRWLRSPG